MDNAIANALTRNAKPLSVRVRPYLRRSVFESWDGRCLYCRADLTFSKGRTWGVIHLIPVDLGGIKSADNHAVACQGCARRHARADVLDALLTGPLGGADPTYKERVLALRDNALLHSFNHLTPLSPRNSPPALRAALDKRFKNERATVHVHVGVDTVHLALAKRSGSARRVAEVATYLRMAVRARPVPHAGKHLRSVFELERAAFADAAWALIEENVLLKRADGPLSSDPNDPSDWKTYWDRVYTNPRENLVRHRRGERAASNPVKRVYSSNSKAVNKRRRDQVKRAVKTAANLERERLLALKVLAGNHVDFAARDKAAEAALLDFLKHNP